MGLQFPPGQRPAWLNGCGELLPEKLPLDPTLARALSGDKRECREAVRLLGMMRQSGRVEAGIYLMGLLAGAPDDWEWRTATCSQRMREKVRCIVDGKDLRWDRDGFGDQ